MLIWLFEFCQIGHGETSKIVCRHNKNVRCVCRCGNKHDICTLSLCIMRGRQIWDRNHKSPCGWIGPSGARHRSVFIYINNSWNSVYVWCDCPSSSPSAKSQATTSRYMLSLMGASNWRRTIPNWWHTVAVARFVREYRNVFSHCIGISHCSFMEFRCGFFRFGSFCCSERAPVVLIHSFSIFHRKMIDCCVGNDLRFFYPTMANDRNYSDIFNITKEIFLGFVVSFQFFFCLSLEWIRLSQANARAVFSNRFTKIVIYA